MTSINHHCLLCYSSISSATSGFPSSPVFDEMSSISKQLHVIFLLQNLLEIPRTQLETYLSKRGNPEEWIKLCSKCNSLVEQAKTTYEMLLHVTIKFRRIKRKVVDIAKGSVTSGSRRNIKSDITEQARSYVLEHEYGPWADPFVEGDLFARDALENSEALVSMSVIMSHDEPIIIPPTSFSSHSSEAEDDCDGNDNDIPGSDPGQALPEGDVHFPHQCSFCRRAFKVKGRLLSHMIMAHGAEVGGVKCHICGRPCSRPDALTRHLAIVHKLGTSKRKGQGQPTFKSPEPASVSTKENLNHDAEDDRSNDTEYQTPRLLNLKIEVENEMREESLAESILPVEVDDPTGPDFAPPSRSMVEEEEVKSGYQINRCSRCHMTFKMKRGLRAHMVRAHGIRVREVTCHLCNKSFARADVLTRHLGLVHKIGSYKCKKICPVEGCNKSFDVQARLDEHVSAIHFNDPQHKCRNCKKAFFNLSSLKRHEKSHKYIKRKPFQCDNCSNKFSSQQTLGVHLKKCLKKIENSTNESNDDEAETGNDHSK